MKWTAFEYKALLGLLALAVVILLKPHIAIPGAAGYSSKSQDILQDMMLHKFDVSLGEMTHDMNTASPPFLIDIRSRTEYDLFHLPHAYNIPFQELLHNVTPYCKNKGRVILYDQGGYDTTAAQATMLLRFGNCQAYWLKGGALEYCISNNIAIEDAFPHALAKDILETHTNQFKNSPAGNKTSVSKPQTTERKLPPPKLTIAEGC